MDDQQDGNKPEGVHTAIEVSGPKISLLQLSLNVTGSDLFSNLSLSIFNFPITNKKISNGV